MIHVVFLLRANEIWFGCNLFHAHAHIPVQDLVPATHCNNDSLAPFINKNYSSGSRGGSGGSIEPPSPPPMFKYPMKMK